MKFGGSCPFQQIDFGFARGRLYLRTLITHQVTLIIHGLIRISRLSKLDQFLEKQT